MNNKFGVFNWTNHGEAKYNVPAVMDFIYGYLGTRTNVSIFLQN